MLLSCRKVKVRNSSMGDGGLFGGREHTVWFYLKLPFSTRSILVCILTKCQHQFENTHPKIGLWFDYKFFFGGRCWLSFRCYRDQVLTGSQWNGQELWRYCHVFPSSKCDWCSSSVGYRYFGPTFQPFIFCFLILLLPKNDRFSCPKVYSSTCQFWIWIWLNETMF